MSPAVPKPPARVKAARKPLKRGSPLKVGKPLAKVNPTREVKRATKARKHYASPEYKAAKAARMKIADRQCEARHVVDPDGQLYSQLMPNEELKSLPKGYIVLRCPNVHRLSYHEIEYGSDLGILREIDGFILCEGDHRYIEVTRHSHRQRNR